MAYEAFSTLEMLSKAWFKGGLRTRLAVGAAIAMVGGAVVVAGLESFSLLDKQAGNLAATLLVGCAVPLALGVIARQRFFEQEARSEKIAMVEQRARENPEKPQLAWDLARTKLESYLDRNLSQVRSIYWLTLLVMFVGFGFILYGIYSAFQFRDSLPVSIVASASGVIVSFLGGSFLLIYRSILSQSKDYVSVLERINAVGMAVHVISSIPEGSGILRDQTTAELAKQLLGLYASPQASLNGNAGAGT